MNLHAKLSTLLLVLLLSSVSIAQDLQLGYGRKTQTFKAGKIIRVVVPAEAGNTLEDCPNKYFVGRLISYKDDTLSLRVRYETECIPGADKKIGTQSKNYDQKLEEEWPVVEISGNDIISITRQGSKNWQPLDGGDIVGNLLILLGLVEIAVAGSADTSEEEDALLGAGLFTTGVGLVTVVVFGRKIYYIENSHNVVIKDKTWNIL